MLVYKTVKSWLGNKPAFYCFVQDKSYQITLKPKLN
ncbi:hypothetical protein J801_1072, partial [Acinetobacter baumannii 45002_8]